MITIYREKIWQTVTTVVGLCLVGTGLQAFDSATQDDTVALARHFQKPESGKAATWGNPAVFDPKPGETISLMGGATVVAMQDSGTFETRLHRQFPDRKLRVRNLGWQSDTVYRQQRPMFFYTEVGETKEGSTPDQRERIAPGILMMRFGKQESLDGPESLAAFGVAYRNLIDALASFSQRIVLVAPEPFFATGPAGELAEKRNEVLESFVSVIREIAQERGYLFADLFHELKNEPSDVMSRTGIDLTVEGQVRLARVLADQLKMEPVPETNPDLDEKIQALVIRKNHLWQQYYRPTNWAFLYGDRQHVPSSRDHRDANRRWFVEELNKLPGLIAEVETELDALP